MGNTELDCGTKAKDLAVFEYSVGTWIKKLGLFDWDKKVMEDDETGCNGHVMLNPVTRKATIFLCKNREGFVTIEEIAKHECLEIMLADIGFLLKSFYSDDVVDDEIHKVINRLMIALV